MNKRKVLVVIAHPDDEAFGPAGTLAILAKTHEVHIACVTQGDADPRFHKVGGQKLADIRVEELKASAHVLGIKKVHMLGFTDGSLNNNLYHEIAGKISDLVDSIKATLLITTELRGISGHIDHVVCAMATSFVYHQKQEVDALWLNCVSRTVSDDMGDYFIYFPPGFERDEVDMTIDISSVFTQKIAAAKCHVSQQKDADRAIARWIKSPKEEWFFVMKRRDVSVA